MDKLFIFNGVPFNRLPCYAVWRINETEQDIKIISFAGDHGGKKYFYAEGIITGIPEDQIFIPICYFYKTKDGKEFSMETPFENHTIEVRRFYEENFGENPILIKKKIL